MGNLKESLQYTSTIMGKLHTENMLQMLVMAGNVDCVLQVRCIWASQACTVTPSSLVFYWHRRFGCHDNGCSNAQEPHTASSSRSKLSS